MALTWTQMWTKTQRLTKDAGADTLVQLKQDLNTGYHMFNAKLARYYSRKQQFADLKASQQIYQTPLDCVRVLGVTALVTSTYEPPVTQVRDEQDWRNITSVKSYKTNWPTWYFMIGNDELAFWPIPSQDVVNGIRFYYQPQDHDLTVEDVTSTSTNATVTVTNGSPTVTASSAVFNAEMASLFFQVNGVTDVSWYEIISATTTTLTLKSAYVGNSGSSLAWTVGQQSIIPQEFADAPMHYALGNYFSAAGNEGRSAFHLGTKTKPGMFYHLIEDCLEEYSSSSESSVVSEDGALGLNMWVVPPPNSN